MPRISIENLKDIDPTSGYVLSDYYASYYGYLNTEGQWYIMYYPDDGSETLFAKGESGYPANWLARADLTYGTYDEVF